MSLNTLNNQVLTWYDKISGVWVPGTTSLASTTSMDSLNHFPLDTEVDDGGPWFLSKSMDSCTPGDYPRLQSGQTGNKNFSGQFTCPVSVPFSQTTIAPTGDTEMNSLGTTGLAHSAPTNPIENLGSAIAESYGVGVVPLLPGVQTWRDRTHICKSAGNEYINVEFGWLPLVSDIRKTMYAVKHHTELIRQFQAGSGQKTRASFHFPDTDTTKYGTVSLGSVPSKSFVTGQGQVTEEYLRSTWFKGCFKYHVPIGDSASDRLKRYESYANHLLGIRLTPEVLWNATPWSWLADWQGTTGDVLRNIALLHSDGLVMQYGYVMDHKERVTTILGDYPVAGGAIHIYTTRSIRHVYKRRLPATPYGFGFDMTTLTSSQTAILVALGLTKGIPGFSH